MRHKSGKCQCVTCCRCLSIHVRRSESRLPLVANGPTEIRYKYPLLPGAVHTAADIITCSLSSSRVECHRRRRRSEEDKHVVSLKTNDGIERKKQFGVRTSPLRETRFFFVLDEPDPIVAGFRGSQTKFVHGQCCGQGRFVVD